jgi:hypothetical protein
VRLKCFALRLLPAFSGISAGQAAAQDPFTAIGCRTFLALAVLFYSVLCSGAATTAAAQYRQGEPGLMRSQNAVGVYAHMDVEVAINEYSGPPNPSTEQLHAYMRGIYAHMFANPAIAGIALGEHWDSIQTRSDGPNGTHMDQFDWSYLDDAFSAARATHKFLRLIITPGIYSPTGLLNEIPPCDGLFPGAPGPVSSNCGTVQFAGVPEKDANAVYVFPLPWNIQYQNAWKDFLEQLNARYKYDEAFAAVAVAGPVGGSTEMILPTDNNDSSTQPSGEKVNQMWETLIEHSFPNNSTYWKNDQVFINSWEQAINTFESVFAGISLDLTPDSADDLPEFSSTLPPNLPAIYNYDCSATIDVMSCEAKVEIITYFIYERGPNGKSTQVGGLTASGISDTAPGDIGLPGVKLVATLTPLLFPPIRGGAQFDFPVSDPKKIQQEGCTSPGATCSITPEEAAYNVLTIFFDGTPVGAFYGGASGPAPMQYVAIDYTDVQYAEMNLCPPTPSTTLGKTSLQDLMNRASHSLFEMAGLWTPLPPHTCN